MGDTQSSRKIGPKSFSEHAHQMGMAGRIPQAVAVFVPMFSIQVLLPLLRLPLEAVRLVAIDRMAQAKPFLSPIINGSALGQVFYQDNLAFLADLPFASSVNILRRHKAGNVARTGPGRRSEPGAARDDGSDRDEKDALPESFFEDDMNGCLQRAHWI